MLNKLKMLSVRRKALESWDAPLPYLKVEFLSAHMNAAYVLCYRTRQPRESHMFL